MLGKNRQILYAALVKTTLLHTVLSRMSEADGSILQKYLEDHQYEDADKLILEKIPDFHELVREEIVKLPSPYTTS